MPDDRQTENAASEGTSASPCSTCGYESITYSFHEEVPSICLNDIELALTHDVILWLEECCAKARRIRSERT